MRRVLASAAWLIALVALPASANDFTQAEAAFKAGEYPRALILGKTAAAGGDTQAQILIAHMYESGKVGAPDYHESARWYQSAAMAGDIDGMLGAARLGLAGHGGLTTADSLTWFEKAAKSGNTDAMRALSDMYLLGKGTPPDAQKGRDWLIKAANFGDPLAERRLGDLYFEKFPKEALIWYEKAAIHGDARAAYIAAIMYAENFEIRPDAKRAAVLLKQAADAGLPEAMADYGLVIYQGNGTERSIDAAAQWFKKSALAGDPEGRFLYAFTLAKGEGVTQSFEDAYYWLLKADADSGASSVADYDRDRRELRKRLEDNVDPAILQKAKTRIAAENAARAAKPK